MMVSWKFLAISGLCLAAGIGGILLLVPTKSKEISKEPFKTFLIESNPEKLKQYKIIYANNKYEFLHKLSRKVFEFLKHKKKGEADKKNNVVQWLRDRFGSSLENIEDKWEDFKSVCEEQKAKETKPNKEVEKEEFRLCFIDDEMTGNLENSKGNLWLWKDSEEYKDLGFDKWHSRLANIKIYDFSGWNKLTKKDDEAFEQWYNMYTDYDSNKETVLSIKDFLKVTD